MTPAAIDSAPADASPRVVLIARAGSRRSCGAACSCVYEEEEMNAHKTFRNDELPVPARNAEFATSVERFLGLQHVGRHCFAAPLLGL
jgi:hypothetical protein